MSFTHIILLSSILMLLFSCAVSADGLSRKKATVYKKEKITLQLITGRTGKIKWSVSRKGIVKLKASGTSCVVTGKKTGSVKVTAKIGKNYE